MKDSRFISELKKYKYKGDGWQSPTGAKEIAFFMSPKQWTEFRRKFNDVHLCDTCLHCDMDCSKTNSTEGLVMSDSYPSANVIGCGEYKSRL